MFASSPFHELSSLGFSVIPIAKGNKFPVGKWKQFQTELPSEAQLNRWARNDTNIGIVTGPISNLLVLDLDSAEAIEEAKELGLPETPIVKTASGWHVYFQYPGVDVSNKAGIRLKWDIRGKGGYVVAPGSTHPTGAIYEWVKSPSDCGLAPTPDWLMGLLSGKTSEGCDVARDLTSAQGRSKEEISRSRALIALDRACSGIRAARNGEQETTLNAEAFKIGRFVGRGALSSQTAKDRLLEAAAEMPSYDAANPWTSHEIARKIERGLLDGGLLARKNASSTIQKHFHADEFFSELFGETKSGLTIDDFRAHMPTHQYIHIPTNEPWPAQSVDSRLEPVLVVDKNGLPKLDRKGNPVKEKPSKWLDRNRPVEQLTWAPGYPKIIEDKIIREGSMTPFQGNTIYNLYQPPECPPGSPDEAMPWRDLIAQIYPDDHLHIINWFAHQVQHPSEKTNHALVLGGAQGIGKDTILEGVKTAVGHSNFKEASPQDLLGNFNGFVKCVILRINEARDLGSANRISLYEHMKTLTAAPPDVLIVNEKHKQPYAVMNVCGVVITTNHKSGGIYLPTDDRRHFVAWSPRAKADFSESFWTKHWDWLNKGGRAHVAAYLNSVDLSQFEHKAPPPQTEAFWAIAGASRAPEEASLSDALERLNMPHAVTIAQVKKVADEELFEFLGDRKNSRRFPIQFEQCGYTPVRNKQAKDGLFKVNDKRCTIYALQSLSASERMIAAEKVVNGQTCAANL